MQDVVLRLLLAEASSHGLALKRIDAVDFNIAVLTNISDEHLDFHGTRRQYIESKKNYFQCYLQIRLLF